MKESRNTNGQNMIKSSSYERNMERSFAVIYHNLKRIQDEKPLQERTQSKKNTHRHANIQSCINAKARANPSRSQTKANTTDQITKPSALESKPRRVIFSGSVIHIFSQAIPENSVSRPAKQVRNFPARDINKKLQSHVF